MSVRHGQDYGLTPTTDCPSIGNSSARIRSALASGSDSSVSAPNDRQTGKNQQNSRWFRHRFKGGRYGEFPLRDDGPARCSHFVEVGPVAKMHKAAVTVNIGRDAADCSSPIIAIIELGGAKE